MWAEQVFIDFVCKPTLFANDKIRICYYTPMEEGLPEAKTRFVNTNPDDAK